MISGPRALAAGISGLTAASSLRSVCELVPDSAAARAIGKAYLESTDGAGAKLRLLTQGFEKKGPASRAMWVEHVRRQRERDFETADVVVVAGWVLAETEAQLCALQVWDGARR
jgi:hypothetical protein